MSLANVADEIVRKPERTRPTDEQFFYANNKPNVAFLRRHFHAEGRLNESQAIYILERAKEIFAGEPNVLDLDAPITICGDIHGQYYDLMKLFEVGGSVSKGRYLFLGDYVDRGMFSIEVWCVLYLFALKIWYPDRLFLLRGNHECRHLTEHFTFKAECVKKYSLLLYDVCMATFDRLPLAAVVNKQFFCAHGGISPEMTTIDDLRVINRFQEVPTEGLMNDILWSDPAEHNIEPDGADDFVRNSARGCSYFYTYKAVCTFLKRNKLLSIIRAHEAQKDGFRMYKLTPEGFPSIITVFSCPNYLDSYQNKGAVLIYDKKITVRQFTHQPHPYWLPNFMDAFTWTMPFVAQKVANMFEGLLNTVSTEEIEEEEAKVEQLNAQEILARRQAIKNKIRTVGKLSRVMALLREEAERSSELRRLEEGEEEAGVDDNTLTAGDQLARQRLHGFDDTRRSDLNNERLPPSYHYSQVDAGGAYDHYSNGSPYGQVQQQLPHDYVAPSARRWSREELERRLRQTMRDQS
ncbi:related to calcineurin catalytic subunit [Serendipita indica DSM 11827]|uniref:Serine/threonine-protein phosphatase n=1 Tax=Serendipita indica (strain DSM 11827) TaxID=1109443 RepID=G4TLH9_SERID|nr:related to calcineurin catalytic subunit [Serendipita indica DSM 11827]